MLSLDDFSLGKGYYIYLTIKCSIRSNSYAKFYGCLKIVVSYLCVEIIVYHLYLLDTIHFFFPLFLLTLYSFSTSAND